MDHKMEKLADYAEIERIRVWPAARTIKTELLAYLTDKDPFDV
jgi:hypothetical protein